jgi:hypothetical protein
MSSEGLTARSAHEGFLVHAVILSVVFVVTRGEGHCPVITWGPQCHIGIHIHPGPRLLVLIMRMEVILSGLESLRKEQRYLAETAGRSTLESLSTTHAIPEGSLRSS